MGTKIDIGGQGKVNNINTTEQGDITNRNEKNNPWRSGSFYILAFAIIAATLVLIVLNVPYYLIPVVIVGVILLLTIVGAFQLKNDDRITDKSFINLMKLSLKNISFFKTRENSKVEK